MKYKIPFNKPHFTNKELSYIKQAHLLGQLAGDGFYTKRCQEWIEKNLNCRKSLLTHSCTAAMDIMGIVTNVAPGDEVIMPSFTFTSTANAFVLRGATPVFVDIREDTKNIDESLIENAITKRTKIIMVMHYAGVGCEMDKINKIARDHKLLVVEDAAQGLLAKYKGKYLGTLGQMGAFSFHETKNVISGEGGALLVNSPAFEEKAEIVREAGTDKKKFLRGEVDKYSWVDMGSSYLPGEITAAFLMAQLEHAKEITKKRMGIWNNYHEGLATLETMGKIRRPMIPNYCEHNAHIYYIAVDKLETRTKLIGFLRQRGILAVFHYVPLHSSKAGKKFGRYVDGMKVTNKVSNTLLRLPLFYDLAQKEQEFIIKSIKDFYKKIRI